MKHKKTIFIAGVALAGFAAAIFSLANAETIENLQKQIRAAQNEMAQLIPLLDNSGGTAAENAAIKNEVGAINQQADDLASQWKKINATPPKTQTDWQKNLIQDLQQIIDSVKSTFNLI